MKKITHLLLVLMLMASTGELVSIYVSLELSSISLYALVAFLKDKKSSEAGLKYMILGEISSAVLLFGMALVYTEAGTMALPGALGRAGGPAGAK